MADKFENFGDLIAALCDTNHGADIEAKLTKEVVDAVSQCDLVLDAVVERIVTTDRDGGIWGIWPDMGTGISFGYGQTREPEEGELGAARAKLAAAFGAAVDLDHKLRAEQNLSAAEKAAKSANESRRKEIDAESESARLRRVNQELRDEAAILRRIAYLVPSDGNESMLQKELTKYSIWRGNGGDPRYYATTPDFETKKKAV